MCKKSKLKPYLRHPIMQQVRKQANIQLPLPSLYLQCKHHPPLDPSHDPAQPTHLRDTRRLGTPWRYCTFSRRDIYHHGPVLIRVLCFPTDKFSQDGVRFPFRSAFGVGEESLERDAVGAGGVLEGDGGGGGGGVDVVDV